MLNSYKEVITYINNLKTKPRLLLHSCCAPCSSHTILLLKQHFLVTIYYDNDNISPKSEFDKRLEEQITLAKQLGVEVISDNYDESRYDEAVKGLEHLGEKSLRCYNCYLLRLTRTAQAAKRLGFEYFTTTLSISPYKVSKWINEIGLNLEKTYNVNFLYSDFKKGEGYKHSIELSKTYNLYRQDYCGCKYSYAEMIEKRHLNEQNENN